MIYFQNVRDEARRIADNVTKLSEVVRNGASEVACHHASAFGFCRCLLGLLVGKTSVSFISDHSQAREAFAMFLAPIGVSF
jgi:hypothetical protein